MNKIILLSILFFYLIGFSFAVTCSNQPYNKELSKMSLICIATNDTQDISICLGESINVGSNVYDTSGTYIDTLISFGGCDSIMTTNLIIKPISTFNQNRTFCEGKNFTVGSHTYTTSGTYKDTLVAANGCDSIIITKITVKPKSVFSQNITICNGDTLTVGTNNYTSTAIYYDTLSAANGCDSIIITDLSVVSPAPASVSITASADSICLGTNVIFTALPTMGGIASYQWKINSNDVGFDNPVYSSDSLNDRDTVWCVMTSSLSCATGSPAISNSINMIVTNPLSASVTISESINNICTGTNVTFTATPVNGGTSFYQWKLNGNDVGRNKPFYSDSLLGNGDKIKCIMTSSLNCVSGSPATSNTINMIVNPLVIPVAIISASANPICAGTSVVFTASPINGGTAPAYQWKLNSVNVGTNSNTYNNSLLSNGDVISVGITSNANCLASNPGISNEIAMTIFSKDSTSVIITADANPICGSDLVNFIAMPVKGGDFPSYQWKLNGSDVGTNSNVYSTISLNNNDKVKCVMTSTAACPTYVVVISNTINMSVTPLLNPSVAISVSENPTCNGTNVTFTAVPTNGGGAPTYQWQMNGAKVGINSSTFITAAFDKSEILCYLYPSGTCHTVPYTISNVINMTVHTVIANAGPDESILLGDSIKLNATGGIGYKWNPISGLSNPNIANPMAGPNGTTNYVITVTDVNNCTNKDSVMIFVDISKPTPPTDLMFSPQKVQINGIVRLDWMDHSGNERGFVIERSPDSTNWKKIDSVPANKTTFFDSGILNSAYYCYRVAAFNNAGISGYSNKACAVTNPSGLSNNINSEGIIITVTPNPFSNKATVKIISDFIIQHAEVKLYNVLGKEVKSIRVYSEHNEKTFVAEIKRDDLSSGIYFYKINNDKGIVGQGKLMIAD